MSSLECANTNALNQYMNSINETEDKLEEFYNYIDYDVAIILQMIQEVKDKAKDFDGYDFTEDLEFFLRSEI